MIIVTFLLKMKNFQMNGVVYY